VGLRPVRVGVFGEWLTAPDTECGAERGEGAGRALGESSLAGLYRGKEGLGVDPAAVAVSEDIPARAGPDQCPVAHRAADPANQDLDVPRGVCRGLSGHSASAIRSLGTNVPRRSASNRRSRRASLPPNSPNAISCPSCSTANRPSSLILITAVPPGNLPPGSAATGDLCGMGTPGGELAAGERCPAGTVMADSPARHTPCDRPQIAFGSQIPVPPSTRDSAEAAPGSDRVSCTLPSDSARYTGPKLQAGHRGRHCHKGR
jgi:hypothetical protein